MCKDGLMLDLDQDKKMYSQSQGHKIEAIEASIRKEKSVRTKEDFLSLIRLIFWAMFAPSLSLDDSRYVRTMLRTSCKQSSS